MHISEYACKTCLKKLGILLNAGKPLNINLLAKTKRCPYAEFYEFKIKTTGKGKQKHIFQKSKSYEISSTVIYAGKDQKFIIHVFYWCIPSDHEIYTKFTKIYTKFTYQGVMLRNNNKLF